jgi:hypothetical protein
MKEYIRPEVVVLGDAADVIRGSKPGIGDGADPTHKVFQNELTED